MSSVSQPVIALDATTWDAPTTGISLYVRSLARALERAGARVMRLGARSSGEAPRGVLPASLWTVTRAASEAKGRGASLYHAVGNFDLPLRPGAVPYVLTVHDLIPQLFPRTVSRRYRALSSAWLSRSTRIADRIVCVSERTRRDLVSRHPDVEARIDVIPLGVDHIAELPPLDAADTAELAALKLPDQFILYGGSFDARKNVGALLDAIERLRSGGVRVPVVLMGQAWFGSAPLERRIERLCSAGVDLRVLGHQSAPVFYEVMRRATIFVFPSLYEGFGLPPLEAMSLGVPTIISNGGSLPEVCGPAAATVDLARPTQLDEAIARLWASPFERRDRAASGREWASQFTWSATAARTLNSYRRVADFSTLIATRDPSG